MTEQKHLAAALRQMQIRVLPFRQKQKAKHIKVVVIPQTISGTTGEAAEYKVEAFVREGLEDPSSTGSDIELGKGS